MATQITHKPSFEVPFNFKKVTRWAKRKVPDGYSDGDPRHWPGGPQYRPTANEFYLCVLGQKWAEHDGIAEPGVQYYLDKLPDGYAMFEADQPSGIQTYKRLFGHPTGRFYDSALRFAPHFLWLMSGMDGECDCIYCAKKDSRPIVRRQRLPHDSFEKPALGTRRYPQDLTDDNDENDSSRGSSTIRAPLGKRTQRQARQTGVPTAVDEEGTEDIYKDCVKKLQNARGGTRGVEIDLTEDGSIDWKAERVILPRYLTQIEQQHSFIPRVGELVLWCPTFLDDHYLMLDPATSEYKFYTFEQKCFHGFPAWRGGVVTSVPSASVKNGPVDFPDILYTPTKKTSFNTAGFRIETMPDPNDDMDKSMSKQYKYVPLQSIRPLTHWQILLKGMPEKKLHPSIEYALTCMTSLTVLEKWRFNGDWPNARIFCKAVYVGSELITIGDAVRLLPSTTKGDIRPDVLIVDSIRYNLLDMQPGHATSENEHLCGRSFVSLVGSAYTTNLDSLTKLRLDSGTGPKSRIPLTTSEVKTMFRTVGAEEYGQWYPWHGLQQRYEVSHEQILGRLYEADAIRLWTGQRQTQMGKHSPKPSLDFDRHSVRDGRLYATQTDARLPEPQNTEDINWYFADTRAEALALASFNGVDIGKYHEVRTPATLKQWRFQVRVADGQPIAPEISDEYIRDLAEIQLYTGARRGRPAGSRVVDGKLVRADQSAASNDTGHVKEHKTKPSSQMAGAALATDNESSEEYYSNDVEDYSNEEAPPDHQLAPPKPTNSQVKMSLSKADIMNSIEVPEDEIFDDDVSEEEPWWNGPMPPLRGGTEESEGGDYRE